MRRALHDRHMMTGRTFVLASSLLLVTLSVLPTRGAGQTPGAPPTFSATVAPIVYTHCVECHRPDGPGPFPLITYDDVAKRGSLIATVTSKRVMPPWHAVHGYGEFAGERWLSDREIAVIAEWVANGMPRGDATQTPAPPTFSNEWQLGQPDLVLEMPAGFQVPADGMDLYRNFVLPTGLHEDRWVRAIELRPSSRRVVHHALFAYASGGTMSKRDGADGKPGFPGNMAIGVLPGPGGSGGLGGWAVGGGAMRFPDGLQLKLPADSDFVLQVHLHPSGKAETERSKIGLYFSNTPPTKTAVSAELPALFGFGAGIDIPAGEANYVVRETLTLPAAVNVYSAYAHAHYLGKEMKVDAVLPDGSKKPLLWIRDWDFNWQEFYSYKDPVALPAGTRLEASIRYDNSSANPRNPHSPPQRVQWGLESTDEMGTIGLLLEIPDTADAPALQEAMAQRTREAIQKGVADGTVRRYLAQQAALGGS
jgi:mono/diheme cytochrome c family protein